MNYQRSVHVQVGGAYSGVVDNLARGFGRQVGPEAAQAVVNFRRAVVDLDNLNKGLNDMINIGTAGADAISRQRSLIENAVKGVDNLKKGLRNTKGGPIDPDLMLKQMDESKDILKAGIKGDIQVSGLSDDVMKDLATRLGTDVAGLSDNLKKGADDLLTQKIDSIVDDVVETGLQETLANPVFIRGLNSTDAVVKEAAETLVTQTVQGVTQVRIQRFGRNIGDEFIEPLKKSMKTQNVISEGTEQVFKDLQNLGPGLTQAWKGLPNVTDDIVDQALTTARQGFSDGGKVLTQTAEEAAVEMMGMLKYTQRHGAKNMDEAVRMIVLLAKNNPGDEMVQRVFNQMAVVGDFGRSWKKMGRFRTDLTTIDPNVLTKRYGNILRGIPIDKYITKVAKDAGNPKLIQKSLPSFSHIPVDSALLKNMSDVLKKSRRGGWTTKIRHGVFALTAVAVITVVASFMAIGIQNSFGDDEDEFDEEQEMMLDEMMQRLMDLENEGELPQGTAEEFLYTVYEAMVEAGNVDPALEAIIQCLESGAEMDLTPFAEGSYDFVGFAKDLDKYGCLAYQDPNNPFFPEGIDNSENLEGIFGGGGDGGDDGGLEFFEDMFSEKWLKQYWWVLLIVGIVVLMLGGLVIFLVMSG